MIHYSVINSYLSYLWAPKMLSSLHRNGKSILFVVIVYVRDWELHPDLVNSSGVINGLLITDRLGILPFQCGNWCTIGAPVTWADALSKIELLLHPSRWVIEKGIHGLDSNHLIKANCLDKSQDKNIVSNFELLSHCLLCSFRERGVNCELWAVWTFSMSSRFSPPMYHFASPLI